MKRLFGKARAIRLIAWPLPQPMSATSMPGLEPLRQPRHERQDRVDQRGVEDCAAVLRHQRLEARERRVGHAAAVAEAVDDLVLDLCPSAAMNCVAGARLSGARRARERRPRAPAAAR